MLNIPYDLKYTKTHEWIKIEKNEAKVGITDFAQHEITDIVHIELPELGKHVKKGQPVAVIESVKSAFDIYTPVSGNIIKVNDIIFSSPEVVNQYPYESGYLFTIEFTDDQEFAALLDAESYKKII
ncbi:MAG: glycine cleavage system protein GcvH [Endomicrobium sp.]|jgi:glycine cleavage system H protein|nr:glycine cleavage system protein GcvH [Endomicrobium sp.]